jgi:hypothetical protein
LNHWTRLLDQEDTTFCSRGHYVLSLIGNPPADGDLGALIFPLPSYESCCKSVKRWVKRAGINKHISWRLSPVDTEKGDLKRQIASVVKSAALMYHYRILGEYKALLSIYHVGLEEVKGERNGKPYHGLLYCALDKDGQKFGTPLKSFLFGKPLGHEAMERRMGEWTDKVKERIPATRMIVAESMQSSYTEAEFRRKLQERKIDLFIRRNADGRIYGVTFIDHNSRCVMNGSRLGKAFSANALHDWFENGVQPDMPEAATNRQTAEHLISRQQEPQVQSTPSIADAATDLAGSLFSVLSPEPSDYDDINNRPERWLPKKKKKRKFGRQL